MALEAHPWWPICKGCGLHTIDPGDPPRYDILNPEYGPEDPMDDFGPYDVECFATTITGSSLVESTPEEG